MGTLPEVPSHGLIYLPSSVSTEFNKSLNDTDHASADSFLEHLFELFSAADEDARVVKVRPDLAHKFAALQQGSQYGCSSELMKHLLQLHVKSTKEAPTSGSVKQTSEKPVVSASSGRKSRKSQPKRNVKHQVLLDPPSDEGEPGPEGPASRGWREGSLSSEGPEVTPTDPSGDVVVPFDLSVVKQEVVEEDGENTARESTGKGGAQDQRPLCLTLHKPKLAQQATRRPPQPEGPNAKPAIITLTSPKRETKPGLSSLNAKNSKPLFQLNWRSSSEPPSQALSSRPPPLVRHVSHENSSPDPYHAREAKPRLYPGMAPPADQESMEEEAEERGGYNYVLNSLASDVSDNKYQTSSLPGSPMHVPVNYPKSIHYVLSSDEDEPQDLSYGSQPESEQPQNLSMAKPAKSVGNQPAVKAEAIKYDSNANAVAVAPQLAQHPEKTSQFIAQSPFSVPANLIFNDHCSVNNELLGQPQIFHVPHSSSGSKEATVLAPPPGMILAAPPPRLQVVNVIGAAPHVAGQVFVQPSIISSKSNFQPAPGLVSASTLASVPALAPAPFKAIVTSPDSMTLPDAFTGSDADLSPEQGSPGSRKKRKKMDDTTTFRDPPETSLPFNGPNKYRFYCDVCDTGFTRRYTFNRHKCKGRVEKHYCQMCDKAYLSKYKLKDHVLVKHEGQTVSCPACGKKFSSRSSMEMHKKQQHEGQFSIWCKICGKGFNHTGHYYGHMNKHTNTKPFWCQQCGKRFYGSSYLHNHKQVCRGNTDLNYPCTVCDRRFKCELYLKKHMKTHENIPIIADPSVAKLSGVELSEAGLGLPGPGDGDEMPMNGDLGTGTGGAVFPNGPDTSDSNSNSGLLMIDENMNAEMEGKEGKDSSKPADLSGGGSLTNSQVTPQEVQA